MFLYSFNNHYGYDTVAYREKTPKRYKIGDLVWVDAQYMLFLGEEVSFQEQYTHVHTKDRDVIEHYSGFFHKKTISMIHRMRNEWYATYKKIVPLFIHKELDYVLQKSTKKNKTPVEHHLIERDISSQKLRATSHKKLGQQLIVFPDLWTLYHTIGHKQLSKGYAIATSQTTKAQQTKLFWGCSDGSIHTVITTYANIFQNRKDLQTITVIFPQKWYYNPQQDPRYKTIPTIKKMAALYNATITYIE